MSSEDSEARAAKKKESKSKELEGLVDSEDFSEQDEEHSNFESMKVRGKMQHSTIDTSKVELWLIRAPLGLDPTKLAGVKLPFEEEPFADGTISRFELGKSHYYCSQEPLAHLKNVVNLFPNDEEERIEFGKPFTRNIKISEVLLNAVAADSAPQALTAQPQKKKPELFVRFAPPGAKLPGKIKLQKKSEIETGWKAPDFVPYVTNALEENVAAIQRKYEEQTKTVKAEKPTAQEKKKRKHESDEDEKSPAKKKAKK